MKKFYFLIIYLLSASMLFGQDFSNKGKDFWVAYGYHQVMSNGNGQEMVLYFATDQVTNITITIPGTGYVQNLVSGALPSVLTSNPIPKIGTGDVRLLSASSAPENKGIHITSDRPIVAYAHIYNQNVSGASILFPTNTLGKEYYSINYTNTSNTNNANCWFYVVATDTGTTTVEITPSANAVGHAAGVPFTVNLTQGQVYNVMGELTSFNNPYQGSDLTGSKIKSISSGTSSCKRIAVFSGSGRISITCNGLSSSSDNYMVQAFPKTAWGKKYLTTYTGSLSPLSLINNVFRICVTNPATVVNVNGAPITQPLINNFYYEIPATSSPLKIEADLPICVAQYVTSQGACGNGTPGDPEVIYLSPVEQNIAQVIWNATPNFNIQNHYYNVVIPNGGTAISSFKLDGVSVNPSLFTVHPQDPNYSYLIANVAAGQHRIESDSGFNAIAYGFGSAESYGYNAGTNIRDLYNFLSPLNPLSLVPDPVACTGTPIFLSVTFPFQPTSLFWDFHGFQTPNVTINNPATINDSTYLIGTKRVWRYKLPTMYTYSPSNTSPGYPITITAGTTDAEGCGNSFVRDFDLAVYDPPTSSFQWTSTGCVTDSVRFNDNTSYLAGTYSYKWYWNFGDGTIDSVRNPVHLYANPGTYIVKFAMVSNVGCLSDTASRTIVISPKPLASISGNNSVCLNATSPNISFSTSNSTAPYTFSYNINGGPTLTATSATSNTVNVPVPTTATGTFTYNLLNITGNTCSNAQSGNAAVIVNPLPDASISGTTAVCQNATRPVITFTVTSTTVGPYTFSYQINGGAIQTLTTTGSSTVATVTAPTGTVGTYVYTLLNVTDGSSNACRRNLTNSSATITVNPLPTATISGNAEVCRNATAPLITFTGANATAPYTFTYTINGGPNQTVTTTTGNSVTVSAPTGTAGTFVYTLVSVQDGSTTACSQPQSGTVNVNCQRVCSHIRRLPVP